MKITTFVRTFAVITACLTLGAVTQAKTIHYNCNAQRIPKTFWDLNRDKNQFLYSNDGNHQRHYGWACGHKQIDGCKTSVFLLMPSGHYWKNEVRTEIELYSCNSVGGGSAWEPVGATGGGYIRNCTSDKLTKWKNNHVQYGMDHYFCQKMVDDVCVDETRTSNAAQTNGICRATDDQFRCIDNGGKWNDSLQTCENSQDCEKYGATLVDGQCQCPEGQLLDTRIQHCVNVNECSGCNISIFSISASDGSIVIIGDNNSNISNGGNHNTNTNSNNNGSYNGGGGNSSSLQNCLNSRTTTNGKACCYLPKTGANGAQYDAATDKCNCNAAGKTFSVGTDGRGQCIGGNGPNPTTQCPANIMYVGSDGTCKCNAQWQDPAEERNKVCKCGVPDTHNDANGNCECNDPSKVFDNNSGQCVAKAKQCPAPGMEFDAASGNCKCVNPYQREINNFTGCECTVPGAKNDANNVCQCTDKDKVVKDGKCEYGESGLANIRANINAAFSSLSSKMGGFEKSVWKDAEGNFNTARLASDSIAGVVLGTAGGIITSKLVKKSQLKKGFEDIKCSIGGQNVASYGDTFSVGM